MVPDISPKTATSRPDSPRIVPRSQHAISRQNISPEALKVLYRLCKHGLKAYLVGGGVRDLYLGRTPKDFDIATDARPSRLKKIFRNCRIIGRRFRIAHVFFPGDKIVEVATFRRGEVQAVRKGSGGVVLLDNEFGTPEEDAKRRDLTINGLFYDVEKFSIIDYVGGVEDLDNRIVRTIKDPDESFQEDPVRMIRVLRHAARTGFDVDAATLEALKRNRTSLRDANPSRLMEETFRDLRGGAAAAFFERDARSGLLEALFPALQRQLQEHGESHPLPGRLEVLDRWARKGRPLSNPLLVASLLHTVFIPRHNAWRGENADRRGIWKVLQKGSHEAGLFLRISRRDKERVFQVLLAFPRLMEFVKQRTLSPSYQRKTYLADALEFLELELQSSGVSTDLVAEWRETYAKNPPPRPSARSRRGGRGRGMRRGKLRRRSTTASATTAAEASTGDAITAQTRNSNAPGARRAAGANDAGTGEPARKKRKRRRRRKKAAPRS